MLGYHSQVILAGRRINDEMGKYIAENCVKLLIKADKAVKCAKVAILGFTFKENCPDTRNTRVIDIVNELKEYGIEAIISDPVADKEEANRLYGVAFEDLEEIHGMDGVIIAVAHEVFKGMSMAQYIKNDGVIVDVKGILNKEDYSKTNRYWRM